MAERPSMHQLPVAPAGAAAGATGPPPPEPSHAERCRTLVASVRRGALATIALDPVGYPYGSVASYALDDRGDPLLLVSLMAEHTQNALHDPRASLLVTEPVVEGSGVDPLASGRVTLLGRIGVVGEDDPGALAAVRERYLATNPAAAYYVDYGDFAFYRLRVEAIRYVGGYGRMSWVDPTAYAAAAPDPLAGETARGIVAHMNADHADAQVVFCRHLAGLPDTVEASLSAVDRYGFELVAVGPSGRTAVRLGFPEPCDDGGAVRRAMVALVAEARRRVA